MLHQFLIMYIEQSLEFGLAGKDWNLPRGLLGGGMVAQLPKTL